MWQICVHIAMEADMKKVVELLLISFTAYGGKKLWHKKVRFGRYQSVNYYLKLCAMEFLPCTGFSHTIPLAMAHGYMKYGKVVLELKIQSAEKKSQLQGYLKVHSTIANVFSHNLSCQSTHQQMNLLIQVLCVVKCKCKI